MSRSTSSADAPSQVRDFVELEHGPLKATACFLNVVELGVVQLVTPEDLLARSCEFLARGPERVPQVGRDERVVADGLVHTIRAISDPDVDFRGIEEELLDG